MARLPKLTMYLTILFLACAGCKLQTPAPTEAIGIEARPTGVEPAEIIAAPSREKPVDTEATQATDNPVAIEVHLWQTYDNDEVQIRIDGQVVFSNRVTTDDILSLAARIPITVSAGSHVIGVTVNRSQEAEATFHTQDVVVIAVSYTPAEDRISWEFLDTQPAYR